jgi:PAS domain S-box-containing protein
MVDKLFRGTGLKTKIIEAIIFVIILTTTVSSGFFYIRTKTLIFTNLQKRGKIICENLSYSVKHGVLTEDMAILNELAEGVMQGEGVVYVVIQDEQGKTLVEKTAVEVPGMIYLKEKARRVRELDVSSTKDISGNPIYNFSCPIVVKKVMLAEMGAEERSSPQIRGTVQVGLTLSNVLNKMAGVLKGIILLTLIVVGCGIIFSFGFVRIIMKPIRQMTDAAVRIASGDLTQRVEVKSHDEIGQFACQFNAMTEALKRREEQLSESCKQISTSKEQLEVKVKNRTSELSTINVKLAEEIAERSLVQKKLQQNIKQLNCLYGLSKLVEQPQISLGQIFQETVYLIRNAYQHPDSTCVAITFDGIQYKTDNFEKTELSQCAQIRAGGGKAGNIEVYRLAERSEDTKDPFLKEERDLLSAVADQLSKIAEHRRTEEKLRLFRNLIERSNDCIFVLEPRWGRFLDVNDRVCNTLGYAREELLRMTLKDVDEFIPADSLWQEHVKELKLKGDVILQSRYRRKNATTFFAEASLRYISHEKEGYIIAIARDITERKKAEERQAQLLKEVESVNQELKDFAYVVSHDLKAPLRGIGTLANWISTDYADKLDEEGKEQMTLLLRRVDRMHNLIDGVLQYSRVGRIKEEMVRVDLKTLVPEIIDTLAPPENIEITIEDELPAIEFEETRIIQVFQNLISNAVKYMDKPKGEIKIGCVEENGFWKFSVADSGPGIEERYFERIFKIFQTLSARDEFESTGVGLTVVKKIIEMYGGKIWVESKVGEGSTFLFTLPQQERKIKDERLEANIVS